MAKHLFQIVAILFISSSVMAPQIGSATSLEITPSVVGMYPALQPAGQPAVRPLQLTLSAAPAAAVAAPAEAGLLPVLLGLRAGEAKLSKYGYDFIRDDNPAYGLETVRVRAGVAGTFREPKAGVEVLVSW